MNKLITVILLFTTFTITGQEWEIGAAFMNASDISGVFLKIKGKAKLTDNLFELALEDKNQKEVTSDFDVINQRNGITYLSDGVTTYQLVIMEQSGKKKGFKYDRIMSFQVPLIQATLYYAKLSEKP